MVDFETADEFIHYITKRRKLVRSLFIELYRKILLKLHIMNFIERKTAAGEKISSYNKRLILKEIKGLKKIEIEKYAEEFYVERIKPHLINHTISCMMNQIENGYKIIIISASYMPIVYQFQKDFKIDRIITNQFLYDGENKFMGTITRNDCIGEKKVEYFYQENPGIKLKEINSIAYGDGLSDVFILKEVKRGFVVTKKDSKKWAQRYNLEELIWE